ncbi:LysR substrate-binding domain-containing protein, partial [Microbispora sp. NPDC046933]|uniref:LysR substrate-binding domain-containing protein n=1 Tax=Microbispora sp. NPDC046933 TaxID=3155618 RepID=UPI0033E76AAA
YGGGRGAGGRWRGGRAPSAGGGGGRPPPPGGGGRGPPRPRADLAATPLVVREPGSGTRHALDRLLTGPDVAPPILELSSNAAVKVAVETGVAPAVLSQLAVAAELRDGRLIEVPVADLDLWRPLFAVWRARTRLTGPAAELVRLARTAVRGTS